MAEQVQSLLDEMVPALRDLMENGIFSEVCVILPSYKNLFFIQFIFISSNKMGLV